MELDVGTDRKAILQNGNFLAIWAAQWFCQLADRIFTYVLMIFAFEKYHTNLGTSLPLLTFALPAILFSALFGVFVDRWKKKPILFLSNILRDILVLSISTFKLQPQIEVVLFIALGVFTVAQIFAPAEGAAIPGIVRREQLVFANALFMGTWMAASVLGFGVSVVIIQFFHFRRLYEAAGIFYILAALFILRVHVKEPHRHKEAHPVFSILHELKAGLFFIWSNHIVYVAYFLLFIALSALAAISVLAVGYAELLNISGRNFGLLVVCAGFGMALGIAWIARIESLIKKKYFLIESGFVICGLSLIAIALAPNVYLACFAIFILGFGNSFISSSIQAFLQDFVPEEMRGRVFGVQNMFVSLAFALPAVLAGYLADIFSIRVIFGAMGVGIMLVGLMARLIPDFKRI